MRKLTITMLIWALLVATVAVAAESNPADLTCSQGEDCYKILVLKAAGKPMNLTGYTYTAQIRTQPTDQTPLASLTVDSSDLALGKIGLLLPAATTMQLAGKAALWDLRQVDPSGNVSYIVRGKFRCFWSSTR